MNRVVGGGRVTSLLTAVAAAALLAGCTSPDAEEPAGAQPSAAPGGTERSVGSGTSGGPTTGEVAGLALEDAVAAADPTARGAAGAVAGGRVVGRRGGDSAATAQVVSVVASPASTVLSWQLTAESEVATYPGDNEFGYQQMTGVLLVDAASGQVLAPNTYQVGTDGRFTRCVCSDIPYDVGPDPVHLSGQYPPLAEGTEEVEVRVAGFPPVTVPVERVDED